MKRLLVVWFVALVGCKSGDSAVDTYVNQRMPMPLARYQQAMAILRSTSGADVAVPEAPVRLARASKALHATRSELGKIVPPPDFKATHEALQEAARMLGSNTDEMLVATAAHDDHQFTTAYTAMLSSMSVYTDADARWHELVGKAGVTQAALPPPPAD